jgi:quercetin dioxygenase-like cupin family protein
LLRRCSHMFLNMQSEIHYCGNGGGITEKAQDPLKVAKNVYSLVMENDRVRVLEVKIKPGDKAAMHHHPDHVVYVLKGGKAKLTSSGKTDVLEMKAGQAMFIKAQSHETENTGKTDIDLIVVELK